MTAPCRDAESDRGRVLLELASAAIHEVVLGRPLEGSPFGDALVEHPWLADPGATFVTVRRGSELRGCLGSLEARRPLIHDLRHNAYAAASRDPRFPPVEPWELPDLDVEVSLLSPLEPLSCVSEKEALAQLRPGVDGVVFEAGEHRGTFLPQVWHDLPEPVRFLHRLKQKAGLPADFWHPDVRMWRYTVGKWKRSASGFVKS